VKLTERATVSVNKVVFSIELNLLQRALLFSLVGRGNGRRRDGATVGLTVLWLAVVAGGEGEAQSVAAWRPKSGIDDPSAALGGCINGFSFLQ
jgi:hypothetical protein